MEILANELTKVLQPFFRRWYELTGNQPSYFHIKAKDENNNFLGSISIPWDIPIPEGVSLAEAMNIRDYKDVDALFKKYDIKSLDEIRNEILKNGSDFDRETCWHEIKFRETILAYLRLIEALLIQIRDKR